MDVNNNLRNYIEQNIFPLYEKNYIGDGIDRIKYVIKRSENIIKENDLKVNDDILYTAISYHDIRKNNDEKNHEKISGEIMFKDEFLASYFTLEQRKMIQEAIEDQRSNAENDTRNIYGKILTYTYRNSSDEQ